jgi:hypothetical protein
LSVATRDSKQTKPPQRISTGDATPEATGKKRPNDQPEAVLGCFRRRQMWLPTWRGALLIVAIMALIGIAGVLSIHPFLSPNHPIPGGILVVEGWGPDYAMQIGANEFRRARYDRLYVTGGPLEHGGPLSEYKSFAELGAATLEKLGINTNEVRAVPAPLVQQDRTYNSAIALRKYLDAHSVAHPSLNLISVGPHARRSRLLYVKAFGAGTRVGIVAITPRDYDPKHWWRSSAGVRTVLSEAFAYIYVRFFFRPSTEAVTPQ